MGLISSSNLNGILDNCCGYFLDIQGTASSSFGYGTGTGSFGASLKVDAINNIISTSLGDLSLISQLAQPAVVLGLNTTGQIAAGKILTQLLGALQSSIIANAPNSPTLPVRNLDTYLTYLNVGNSGSYWSALQHPAWNQLGQAWFVGSVPSAWNVYADDPGSGPGAVYSGYLRQINATTSVQTAGDTINSAVYAGGFPAVTVTGLTGSGTVTVTGTARDPANYQTTISGRTWSTSISSSSGTFNLSSSGAAPAPFGSLILASSSIGVSAGITGGTIKVVSLRPTGRPVEP